MKKENQMVAQKSNQKTSQKQNRNKTRKKNQKIKRHDGIARATHWTIALSTFALLISGLGQMPLYRRYMVTEIPGFGWMGSFEIHLIIHYVAAAVLIFAAFFHVVYHVMRKEYGLVPRRGDVKESILIIKAMFGRGEEPPQDKYLAEQRLAYAFIAFSFLLIIVTGMVKVAQNFAAVSLSATTMVWMTQLHNLGMVLIMFGIIAHLAAFIIKANRPLVESMFTGKVDEAYAKERHPEWYGKLVPEKVKNSNQQ